VVQGSYDVYVEGAKAKFAALFCAGAGVDGLALDAAGRHLYFTALNGGRLHRVPTSALNDAALSSGALGAAVEFRAETTMSDGMITDLAGNVHLTDIEHSAVTRVRPDGVTEVVARDARLRWPDGLSWTPGGDLLVTNSALHDTMSDLIRTRSGIAARGPYLVLKLAMPAACVGAASCGGVVGQ
jgi:sugar lactone lactonase YvrE